MKPLRAIILRCTSSVAHGAIVRVMQEIPFEFCGSLSCRHCRYPGLSDGNQPWFYSSKIRNGVYEGVNHADLMPLDEEIVVKMRDSEALFMYMVTRMEYARKISYEERKRRYLLHLRFWNDFIERYSINIFISETLPHEIPDYIIYELCKLKGILTLFSHTTPIRDTSFVTEDVEESAIQIKERLEELDAQASGDVALSEQLEAYYKEQTQPEGKFKFIYQEKPQNFLSLFVRRILSKPSVFLHWTTFLFSVPAWIRRIRKLGSAWTQYKLRKFYDSHAVEPDYSKKYIYFPLQFQPECSTCPMAGAFVDQNVSVHLLSSTAPEGVLIYIKEHPRQRKQGIVGRSREFYQELLNMPNVRLVKHSASTFDLREHCQAVATGTGTAGFEALFREKPVIIFGHNFYQYAHSVFQIRTKEDCLNAMEDIFERGEKPDLISVRRFLKAMEDTRLHASISEWHISNNTDLTVEKSTHSFADSLFERIQKHFS
ncbi:hypothetical protein KKF55_02630 [Patescibacteria group bacterium]|nr:hypothetical protein [Patescibacteria group bacterium]